MFMKPPTFANILHGESSPTNKIASNMLSTKRTTNIAPCSKFVVIRKFYKADESTSTTTSANICARKRRYFPYKYSPTGLDEKRRTVKTYERENKVQNYQYGNYNEVIHVMDPDTLKEIENERDAASSIQFNDVDDLADDDRGLDLFTISESTNDKQMISAAGFDKIDALFGSANDDNIEMFELIKTDSETKDVCSATLNDIITLPPLRIDPNRTIKTYQRKNKVKNNQYGNYNEVKRAIIKVKNTDIMPENSKTITEVRITDELLDLCTLPATTHDETKSPILVDKNAAIFGTVKGDGVEMDTATFKEIQNERESASSVQYNDVDGLVSESTNDKQMISFAEFDEIDALSASANDDNIELFELIKTDSEIEESDAVENVQLRNDVCAPTLKNFVTQPPQRIDPERKHESVVVVRSDPHDYQHPQRDCTDFPYPESGKIISVNNISETYKVELDDKDIYMKDGEKVDELRNIPDTLENASTTPYDVPALPVIPLTSINSNGAIDFLVKIENPEFEPHIKTEQEVDNGKIKTKSPILVDKNAAIFGKVEADDKDIYMNDGEKVAELRNIPATLENASTSPYEVPVFTIIPLSSISSKGAAVEFLVKIENPEFEPQIKTEQEVDNEKLKTEPKNSLCETSLREEITITNAQDAIEYLKKLKRFVHRSEDHSALMLMELLEQCLEE